jgi:hypothetical protein
LGMGMTKFLKLLLLLTLLSDGSLLSQSLSHQVLVPAAGLVVDGSIHVSQTIGETAVELFGNTDYLLTQGFQQPGFNFLIETALVREKDVAYPNPVSTTLFVKLYDVAGRSFWFELVTLTGEKVKSIHLKYNEPFICIQEMDVSDLNRGIYLLIVSSGEGLNYLVYKTFKILKY